MLARYNKQAAWLNGKQLAELEKLMAVSRRLARKFLKRTMRQTRRAGGLARALIHNLRCRPDTLVWSL